MAIPRWYANLLIVFLVSGLWHGANWTFVAWGALHGFYLIGGILMEKYGGKLSPFRWMYSQSRFSNFFNIVFTFHLALFAWIFFRANTLGEAFYIAGSLSHLDFANFYIGNSSVLGYSLIGSMILLFVESRQEFFKT